MKKVVAVVCALVLLAVIVPRALDLVSLATLIAEYLFRAWVRASGWTKWYLLTASVTGSWMLAQLTPHAVRQLRRVAEGPSALSAAIETAIMIPLFVVGGVIAAVGAGAAWPLTLTYTAISRRQKLAQRESTDRLEADSLRSEIVRAENEQG